MTATGEAPATSTVPRYLAEAVGLPYCPSSATDHSFCGDQIPYGPLYIRDSVPPLAKKLRACWSTTCSILGSREAARAMASSLPTPSPLIPGPPSYETYLRPYLFAMSEKATVSGIA